MRLKFLFIIGFLSCNALCAQNSTRFEIAVKEFNNDTSAYLQNVILARIDHYIGKPFDNLLRDLPPVIKFFNSLTPSTIAYPITRFNFSSWSQIMEKIDRKEFAPTMVIKWVSPLTKAEGEDLNTRAKGDWNETTADFFRTRIVGSIEFIRYKELPSFKL